MDACKQLSFSSSDDDVPATERNCDGNIDTSKPRTNEKKLNDLKEKNSVKRPQKVVSPVKRILVKRTPKTVGQTKRKPCVDKQVSKFCSPVLSFLASLSGICTACPLLQVHLVCQSLFMLPLVTTQMLQMILIKG